MTKDLSRLLRPKSVAIVGGGAWCLTVIQQLEKIDYAGQIWPVHPKTDAVLGHQAFKSVADLPDAPDAAFVGINRDATIDTIQALSDRNAGGAVCFASGFAEVEDGETLNKRLIAAAGDMPILGPNCYGFLNNLDGAVLWPDQHGCLPVEIGVAILTQSSNIAVNMTMQSRALPISYMVTCGNQTQTTQAEIAMGLLDDPRVTAIGLHIEGFGDLAKWEQFARAAHAKNIPVIALKVGKSSEAQTATISHTASLAGQDAGAQAFLDRLGFARVDDLPVFLDTLKILHFAGPLPNAQIATVSCSGGEASLAADLAKDIGLVFPPLKPAQVRTLEDTLGPKVTVSNPLDYHTYIWRDTTAMSSAFSAMADPDIAMTLFIVDFPRADRCDPSDWDCAIEATLAAAKHGRVAMVSSLPELMPEDIAARLAAGNVIPLSGLSDAMKSVAAAIAKAPIDLDLPVQAISDTTDPQLMTEASAKAALAGFGLSVPKGLTLTRRALGAQQYDLQFPIVLKAQGFAHKSEHNAIALGLKSDAAVVEAAANIPSDTFLIEEMVDGAVAELIIGITRDAAVGFVMTIGAGGVLTELLVDKQCLLLPFSPDTARAALANLKISKILHGYRGRPAANLDAVIDAVMCIQAYVLANASSVVEAEINPLICTPDRAVAADALIRKTDVGPD